MSKDTFSFQLEKKQKELKFHVRFWAEKKKDYDLFKKICKKDGLKVQDVFNQFILQFNKHHGEE